jgi:hypothetical protein
VADALSVSLSGNTDPRGKCAGEIIRKHLRLHQKL